MATTRVFTSRNPDDWAKMLCLDFFGWQVTSVGWETFPGTNQRRVEVVIEKRSPYYWHVTSDYRYDGESAVLEKISSKTVRQHARMGIRDSLRFLWMLLMSRKGVPDDG